jgi:exodeoxyribonuclease VII large subunit
MAEPVSVGVAVAACKNTVKQMPRMQVIGETTDCKPPNARSGHLYFSVKDADAKMDVIMWRSSVSKLDFLPTDGSQVILSGSFDVYAPSGKLSFIATSMHLAGEGVLRQQVAELARKLEAEGLFLQEYKLRVPVFCERVIVVGSQTGHVIHDVARTLRRRNPLVEFKAVGCNVQGAGADRDIIRALKIAEAMKPDAILLVRGGGSYEDLMCFNSEELARWMVRSTVPIVTGIGHEPDVTIADMVSDMRASTPTGAAEVVAPSFNEIISVTNQRQKRLAAALQRIATRDGHDADMLEQRLGRGIERHVDRAASVVRQFSGRRVLEDPYQIVQAREDVVLMAEQRLLDAMPRRVEASATVADMLGRRLLGASGHVVSDRAAMALRAGDRLDASMDARLRGEEAALVRDASALEALSPLKVLTRGYAFVTDGTGRVVSGVEGIEHGDELEVRFADGSVKTEVKSVMESD